MASFGKNIQILRKRKNLTQAQLAEQSGVPLATIKRYETEKVENPHATSINSLASFFNITSIELMEHDFETGDPKRESGEALTSEEILYFFEGQAFNLYYLSEKTNSDTKNGSLSFERRIDKTTSTLRGVLKMHHEYACTMQVDGKTLVINGTGIDAPQHAVLILHCPDFGPGKTFKYRGGIGLAIHINTHNILSSQRVCLISQEMDKDDQKTVYNALISRGMDVVTVFLSEDSNFSQWILKDTAHTKDEDTEAE